LATWRSKLSFKLLASFSSYSRSAALGCCVSRYCCVCRRNGRQLLEKAEMGIFANPEVPSDALRHAECCGHLLRCLVEPIMRPLLQALLYTSQIFTLRSSTTAHRRAECCCHLLRFLLEPIMWPLLPAVPTSQIFSAPLFKIAPQDGLSIGL